MKKKEDGMVMIEAVYVVVTAVMVIFFVMNIGVLYHNRIVLSAAADEAASAVAEIYGKPWNEPFYNYTSPDDFAGANPYRYETAGRDAYKRAVEKKAKWYASYLTAKQELTDEKNMDFSDINVICEENELGYTTVSVTIKRHYKVFILSPAAFFGFEPEYEIQATGSAVCYDVLHRMNAAALESEFDKKIIEKVPLVESVFGLIDKLMKVWKQ